MKIKLILFDPYAKKRWSIEIIEDRDVDLGVDVHHTPTPVADLYTMGERLGYYSHDAFLVTTDLTDNEDYWKHELLKTCSSSLEEKTNRLMQLKDAVLEETLKYKNK